MVYGERPFYPAALKREIKIGLEVQKLAEIANLIFVVASKRVYAQLTSRKIPIPHRRTGMLACLSTCLLVYKLDGPQSGKQNGRQLVQSKPLTGLEV